MKCKENFEIRERDHLLNSSSMHKYRKLNPLPENMESNELILEMKNSVSISDCESPDPVFKFAVINEDSQMSREYS